MCMFPEAKLAGQGEPIQEAAVTSGDLARERELEDRLAEMEADLGHAKGVNSVSLFISCLDFCFICYYLNNNSNSTLYVAVLWILCTFWVNVLYMCN